MTRFLVVASPIKRFARFPAKQFGSGPMRRFGSVSPLGVGSCRFGSFRPPSVLSFGPGVAAQRNLMNAKKRLALAAPLYPPGFDVTKDPQFSIKSLDGLSDKKKREENEAVYMETQVGDHGTSLAHPME